VLLAVSACTHSLPGRPLDALGYALLVQRGGRWDCAGCWPQVALGVLVTVVGFRVFIARGEYPNSPVVGDWG